MREEASDLPLNCSGNQDKKPSIQPHIDSTFTLFLRKTCNNVRLRAFRYELMLAHVRSTLVSMHTHECNYACTNIWVTGQRGMERREMGDG